MKKINFLFLGVSLIISNINIAQNPFASIGKQSKPMLSLSDGKYVEHFENDSVRQIGSAMVNVYTEKIVAFVECKEQSSKIRSQTSSRFLSIDPLARQFPFLTPYQYAGNKPISSIDIDGLEDLDYRVLGVLKNGNALIQVFVEEGSTSNSHKGVTQVHNINTGEVKDQFTYSELTPIIKDGYVVDKGDRNATSTPSDDRGSSNYYFSVNNEAFKNNLTKMKNGYQVDEDGNVKFSSGIFEVKPITPKVGSSSQFDIRDGITSIQQSLTSNIETIISDQLAAAKQNSSDVKAITFGYDSKLSGVFTDDFKKNIQSAYPTAKINFVENPANDDMARDINNTTIETTVEGTPYHED